MRKKYSRANAERAPQGLVLLELAVALAIAALVLLTAFSVYTITLKGESAVTQRMETTYRITTLSRFLKDYIPNAGYSGNSSGVRLQPLAGCHKGDICLQVQYVADKMNSLLSAVGDKAYDCVGNLVPLSSVVTSLFYVHKGALYCQRGNQTAAIVDGIKQAQWWFGIGKPVRYYKLVARATAEEAKQASAVRLCFLWQENGRAQTQQTRYVDCQGREQEAEPGVVLKNFTTTLYIHNGVNETE